MLLVMNITTVVWNELRRIQSDWECSCNMFICICLLSIFYDLHDASLPTDALEVCSSPVPCHTPSPSTTKMFDFTVFTSDSPPSKSCLLSWKGCRECTFSDDQNSDEGVGIDSQSFMEKTYSIANRWNVYKVVGVCSFNSYAIQSQAVERNDNQCIVSCTNFFFHLGR